jgi:hypothetical protein
MICGHSGDTLSAAELVPPSPLSRHGRGCALGEHRAPAQQVVVPGHRVGRLIVPGRPSAPVHYFDLGPDGAH